MPATMTTLEKALAQQAGMKARIDADRFLREGATSRHRISRLREAFRDNWDSQIGADKFGGVWLIGKAKTNPGIRPARRLAMRLQMQAAIPTEADGLVPMAGA